MGSNLVHVCVCVYLCVYACEFVHQGDGEAAVCSSVYFVGVLSLPATTPDREETRKAEVAASTGDTPPGVSLFP